MKFVIGIACGYMVRSFLDSDSKLREKCINFVSNKVVDVVSMPNNINDYQTGSRSTYRSPFAIKPRIILDSEDSAERVLEELTSIIKKYDVVTIADLYDLVGLPNIYLNEKYGWTTMENVNIISDQKGFRLDLPHAESLITMEINSKEQK